MLTSSIKRAINSLLSPVGLEIQRKHTPSALLKSAHLATIIDGGANDGGFASQARAICPNAKIYSFEPVPWIHAKLISTFKADHRFVAYELALGDKEGTRELEINTCQYSSSLLPMRTDAVEVLPMIGPTAKRIMVKTTTLDQWTNGKDLPRPLLLKLDLEGNELAALHGAYNFLNGVDYVLVEISFVCIRDGQPNFQQILNFLDDSGFELMDVYPGIMDRRTARAVWADALFARRTLSIRNDGAGHNHE